MVVSQFVEKLNKVDGNNYTIEEVVQPVNGVYEAELLHDNVNASTLSVYTGSKLTGTRIEDYALSTPSLTPWKQKIRIYTSISPVYISYETDGDTVEAEDVNHLQEAVVTTQKALNQESDRAKAAEAALQKGLEAEIKRALNAEEVLATNLKKEESRAIAKEQALSEEIQEETERAQQTEGSLSERLTTETERAKEAENVLQASLTKEVNRAKAAEKSNADAINAEASRAQAAEKVNTASILTESSRAKEAEKDLQDAITSETIRATEAEFKNANAITAETTRAKAAEQSNSNAISAEITRATNAEKVNAGAISKESTRAQAAEQSNSNAISAEQDRATKAETTLTNNLNAEISRAKKEEASITQTIQSNKPVWDDKYTKNEIDNKFSTLETAIDWKESVATYSSLSSTYPNPQDGWTVNVKDTDYTYRWSGNQWIAISANAIPKATSSLDGLLSKEDKTFYDDANAKKHVHSNKSVLDGITSSLVTAWNSSVTHISDAVKHITATERTNWNDANSKKHSHANKSILDGITQAIVDNWNDVSNKVDKVSGKGLSTNDYTTADKNKLAGIASGAEVNVQADWTASDTASDAYIKNKPIVFKGNGEVGNSTDWNGLTTPGCYKVQMAAWGAVATYHAPNEYNSSLYSYGLLLVFLSAVANENRTVQIYIPHRIDANGMVLLRMLNGSAWQAWSPIYRGVSKSYIGLGNVDNTADANKSVASAAKLTTARTINGTTFSGTANITTANWGTSRNLTIGNSKKVVNGAADVSWSLSEIGAAATSHGTHVPNACTTITDWNNATTTGWYMASGAANAPTTGTWYFGQVIAHNTNYLLQTVYQFTASSDAKAVPKFIRAKTNGTWGVWTNVTVAKAVPSNAVFTDTNTWRGVQNNLTSTSTTDSLSAAQGKVLKDLVDKKVAKGCTWGDLEGG